MQGFEQEECKLRDEQKRRGGRGRRLTYQLFGARSWKKSHPLDSLDPAFSAASTVFSPALGLAMPLTERVNYILMASTCLSSQGAMCQLCELLLTILPVQHNRTEKLKSKHIKSDPCLSIVPSPSLGNGWWDLRVPKDSLAELQLLLSLWDAKGV